MLSLLKIITIRYIIPLGFSYPQLVIFYLIGNQEYFAFSLLSQNRNLQSLIACIYPIWNFISPIGDIIHNWKYCLLVVYFYPLFLCAKCTIDTKRLWIFCQGKPCYGKYFGIYWTHYSYVCYMYVVKFMDSLLFI